MLSLEFHTNKEDDAIFARHLPVGMAPSYHHPKPKGHCSFGFSNDGEIAVIVIRLKKNTTTGFFYNEEPAISCAVAAHFKKCWWGWVCKMKVSPTAQSFVSILVFQITILNSEPVLLVILPLLPTKLLSYFTTENRLKVSEAQASWASMFAPPLILCGTEWWQPFL